MALCTLFSHHPYTAKCGLDSFAKIVNLEECNKKENVLAKASQIDRNEMLECVVVALTLIAGLFSVCFYHYNGRGK